jgi:hypothetical protein
MQITIVVAYKIGPKRADGNVLAGPMGEDRGPPDKKPTTTRVVVGPVSGDPSRSAWIRPPLRMEA